MAVYLNPKTRAMKVFSARDKAVVVDYVDNRLREGQEGQPPAPKRVRRAAKGPAHFDEYDDDYVDDSEATERTRYDEYRLSPITASMDVLSFWNYVRQELPNLAKIARDILAVQVTSAASERVFSVAGHIITKRRSQLSSQSVDDLILLHSQRK